MITCGLWVRHKSLPGACPTKNISIEFEILPKFAMLWYKMYSFDHNEILHTSRQLHCRDVCKIPMWSLEHILNYSTPNFDRISNSIEIPLVGRAPDTVECCYNMVQYNMILHTSLQWLRQNINRSLNSPLWMSYGMYFARIWEKIDHVITAPHCLWPRHGWIIS